ncbi:type II secretion system F family protein [Vibrio syngnathi]|uniref:Bacterial type II secretion system protein F domain protein n=1 Tax=Vibrio syngnathi TaxID=3034029 RepID=A0AA34TS57_9VIBR|nr:type II secretion system F family protein [Vibrio syngnathi]ARP40121.1 Bacterial type II secretion system protein F domain protein [Vibrio syngnathi]
MTLILIASWSALFLCFLIHRSRQNKKLSSLIEMEGEFEGVKGVRSVIDSQQFEESYKARIRKMYKKVIKVFQPNMSLKLVLFFSVTTSATYALNEFFLRQDFMVCLIVVEPLLFFVFYNNLKARQVERFKTNFPDALNILSGAISSGQSIIHAFEYVGKQLDNEVGKEFKFMAERLLIGEDPDDVLERSSNTFPYLEYFFFASTIRINLARGGQLKDVINKINRLMFDSRAVEKKKNALTSEARASAKIIACLPVIFLIILKFTSPENYSFVMFEEAGQPIFYYVLASELVGFFCIWLILRGVN